MSRGGELGVDKCQSQTCRRRVRQENLERSVRLSNSFCLTFGHLAVDLLLSQPTMSTTTELKVPSTEVFPETQVRERIISWWNVTVAERANDPFSPTKKKNTLYEILPEIDSLDIVDCLLEIQTVVGWEIPTRVVKKGGYKSSAEMANHLIPQLRKLHLSHHRSK